MTEENTTETKSEETESKKAKDTWQPDEKLLMKFIGRNADKYLKTWRARSGETPKHRWTFNLGAFFFPLPWLFFRRMYLAGIGFLIVMVGVGALLGLLGAPVWIMNIFSAVVMVLLALFSEVLYLKHARCKLRRLAKDYDREDQEFLAGKNGGTSVASALVGLLLILSVSIPAGISAYSHITAAHQGRLLAEGAAALEQGNMEKARDLLKTAARKGNPLAQNLLAQLLAAGKGGEADLVDAYAWSVVAAMNGDQRAAEMVADLDTQLSAEQKAKALSQAGLMSRE